jgi:hypothetical protein
MTLVVRERGGRPWTFGTPWHGSGRFERLRFRPDASAVRAVLGALRLPPAD